MLILFLSVCICGKVVMIKLWLHSRISNHAETHSEWEFPSNGEPETLRDILRPVFDENKILRQSIVDETGKLREHINIFIGCKNVRKLDVLDTLINDDDEISIFPSVSGG